MKRIVLAATAAIALAGSASFAQAGNVEIGMLVCNVAGGDGFVFGSTKQVACTYNPALPNLPPETYSGVISRYGVDLGFTGGSVMKWAVLATSFDAYGPGALAGRYGGVGAEVTAALGVGTNVLVRQSARDFVLQPVSVQGQTGLNVALGVAGFELASR
ncbi:DUF992 domain-containing protein [Kumtagia ephedrae]|jgi:opacity protein-like surface antigen|uniref:DUF992 domain-containing protein n=1 Tax=Kumtagia ephedrae TaxID=2116701 RepID=A0A2P7S5J7_9HYPH|nr:DUF992 domain-containing protein [Mesorhizobium ephedrae]PSJ57722.1 DUF992 domain-containing protein [Mesorhizobium ephedrae]